MPYFSYTSFKKGPDGKRKWKLRTFNCYGCRGPVITRDPTKMYCSAKCGRNEYERRRKLRINEKQEEIAKQHAQRTVK